MVPGLKVALGSHMHVENPESPEEGEEEHNVPKQSPRDRASLLEGVTHGLKTGFGL